MPFAVHESYRASGSGGTSTSSRLQAQSIRVCVETFVATKRGASRAITIVHLQVNLSVRVCTYVDICMNSKLSTKW